MKKSYKNIISVFVIVAAGVFIVYGVIEIYKSRPVTISQEERLERLKQKAQSGDAEAQYQLGLKYRHGSDVEKDMAQAIHWYQKAAAQGYGKAQNNLAIAYEKGIHVEKDIQKALNLYEQASEEGLWQALSNLCDLYVREDKLSLAFDACLKAAQKGDGSSQDIVGFLYLKGQGTEQNYQEALKWLNKAAERNVAWAYYSLGTMHEDGKGVERDYSKAFEYYKKASDLGNKGGARNLGNMYSDGMGVKPDFIKAGELYKKAGDKEYLQKMESCCLQDTRLNEDQIEACLIALTLENPEVEAIVAALYLSGTYIEKDKAKAAELLRNTSQNDEAWSQIALARLYVEGNGVVQPDPVEGSAWFYVVMKGKPQNENTAKLMKILGPIEDMLSNAFSEEEAKEVLARGKEYMDFYKGKRE